MMRFTSARTSRRSPIGPLPCIGRGGGPMRASRGPTLAAGGGGGGIRIHRCTRRRRCRSRRPCAGGAAEQRIDPVVEVAFRSRGGSAGGARSGNTGRGCGSACGGARHLCTGAQHATDGGGEQARSQQRGHRPRYEAVCGVAEIGFIAMDLRPLGAQAAGEVATQARGGQCGEGEPAMLDQPKVSLLTPSNDHGDTEERPRPTPGSAG